MIPNKKKNNNQGVFLELLVAAKKLTHLGFLEKKKKKKTVYF